ncbi:MAG TPA: hypothetical protein VM367_04855 [Pseudonocardia sp.]|nr:hypothetical protein [Pseudonocardia sp.]
MTEDATELAALADRSTALAAELRDLALRLRHVARLLAEARPDRTGQDWVDRLLGASGTVGREGIGADDLARALARAAEDAAAGEDSTRPSAVATASAARAERVRLGSTAAERVEERSGIRIAHLPDPDVPR